MFFLILFGHEQDLDERPFTSIAGPSNVPPLGPVSTSYTSIGQQEWTEVKGKSTVLIF